MDPLCTSNHMLLEHLTHTRHEHIHDRMVRSSCYTRIYNLLVAVISQHEVNLPESWRHDRATQLRTDTLHVQNKLVRAPLIYGSDEMILVVSSGI